MCLPPGNPKLSIYGKTWSSWINFKDASAVLLVNTRFIFTKSRRQFTFSTRHTSITKTTAEVTSDIISP
jgi:hypothetical protein